MTGAGEAATQAHASKNSTGSPSGPPEQADQRHFWDTLWINEPMPRFDMRCASPCLIRYLAEGKIPLTGRALVPGCGRGYDLLALATAAGAKWSEVLGMDLSPTGVTAAQAYIKEGEAEEDKKRTCRVEHSDFFEYTLSTYDEKFSFIYDYTFACAIPPHLREAWARQMRDLLVPETGVLMTLIYPICEKDGGPPYRMSLEIIRGLLEPMGFVAETLCLLPQELCHPGRDGTSGQWKATSGVGLWRLQK